MSTELNGVMRRSASRGGIQAGRAVARGIYRTVPTSTKEKFVAPVAGFVSAALEITATWPMEYSKTQLQLNRNNPNFSIGKHIWASGMGIFKGLTPMLIGAPIQGLVRFSSMEYFNHRFKDERGKVSVYAGLGAGVATGIVESLLVVAPMETAKTQCVSRGLGLAEGIKAVLATEGTRGMYKGVGATIAKSASNQAIRFVVFNQYKNVLLDNSSTDKLSALQALGGGMLAGVVGCFGNTPVDTIKSRMQSKDSHLYKSAIDCARKMIKEEGVMSLYKGLIPRMGRVLPGQGIIFMSYSMISDALKETIASSD